MATALIEGSLRARLRRLEERRRRRRGYLPLTPIFDGDDERVARATDAERDRHGGLVVLTVERSAPARSSNVAIRAPSESELR